MNRRGFLRGILAAGVAPYVSTVAGVLMPVKKIITPSFEIGSWENFRFIETIWIPPGIKDKSDPLGQFGYAGAKCVVNGKTYGRVNQFQPDWKRLSDLEAWVAHDRVAEEAKVKAELLADLRGKGLIA